MFGPKDITQEMDFFTHRMNDDGTPVGWRYFRTETGAMEYSFGSRILIIHVFDPVTKTWTHYQQKDGEARREIKDDELEQALKCAFIVRCANHSKTIEQP